MSGKFYLSELASYPTTPATVAFPSTIEPGTFIMAGTLPGPSPCPKFTELWSKYMKDHHGVEVEQSPGLDVGEGVKIVP